MKTYTLNQIDKKIKELQEQKELILNLDLENSKEVTNKEWVQISKASYDKELLLPLVKKIFPTSTNLRYTPNEVLFNYGCLEVSLTLRSDFITIYNLKEFDDPEKPTIEQYHIDESMKKYFELLDSGTSCFDLAQYRYIYTPNMIKIIYDHYFKKIDRTKWEKRFKNNEIELQRNLEEYEQRLKELQIARKDILKLIKELSQFTENICYKLQKWLPPESIDKWLKKYNLYVQ